MSDPGWTDLVTAFGTAVAAAAAVYAARTWKGTLENQRADECLSATVDLQAAFGKLISIKSQFKASKEAENSWRLYERLWDSWQQFNRCFFVARRYRPTLPASISNDLREHILALENFLHEPWAPNSQGVIRSPEVSKKFYDSTNSVITILSS